MARYYRGDKVVRHICYKCVHGHDFDPQELPPLAPDGIQLTLPFADRAIVSPTRVLVIDATDKLIRDLRVDPDLIYKIGPEKFEDLVQDRLRARGLQAERVTGTFRKDGGIDLLFYPPRGSQFPYLGACQVKYHYNRKAHTGPAAIRELIGVSQVVPFQIGLVVTNTSFTPDARWVSSQARGLIRLKDFEDLKRWILNNFTDDAEWRDLPNEIEVCPGLKIKVIER